MPYIRFLEKDDIIYIHSEEIKQAKTNAQLISEKDLDACIEAPKATFDNQFLMNMFEMAATYIVSFCIRHPFTDGNKRVAVASALVFLGVNGYQIDEDEDEQLADLVLNFLKKKIDKEHIVEYLDSHSTNIN
ncbi:MAG: type II toxin-antitoxin system death-on-curing family toxin [Fibrobacterales bacterium]